MCCVACCRQIQNDDGGKVEPNVKTGGLVRDLIIFQTRGTVKESILAFALHCLLLSHATAEPDMKRIFLTIIFHACNNEKGSMNGAVTHASLSLLSAPV